MVLLDVVKPPPKRAVMWFQCRITLKYPALQSFFTCLHALVHELEADLREALTLYDVKYISAFLFLRVCTAAAI